MFLLQAYKGLNHSWRYLVVILFVIIGYIVGQIPITIALVSSVTKQEGGLESLSSTGGIPDLYALGMSQNTVFVLLLMMFVVAMVCLYYGVKKVHLRPFKSLLTARRKFDYSRVLFGFVVWMLFSIALEGWSYFSDPDNYLWQWQPVDFMILFIICLTLLPIQTTFEEVFVRGYLLQGMARAFESRWIPVLATSLIFASLHAFNPEVTKFGFGTMMTYYISIALFLAIITVVDDGLELAIGIHTATNMYGALFVTFDSSAIQTPALFKMIDVDPSSMSMVALIACVVFIVVAHQKYKFNWSLLTGPFIPESWRNQISELPGGQDVQVLEVVKEQGSEWTTTNLIDWHRIFSRSRPAVNFELLLPAASSSSHEWILPLSDSKREELLRKMAEFAESDLVRYGDKLRVSLSDGSEVAVALHNDKNPEHQPYPELNWPNYLKIVLPLKSEVYDIYSSEHQSKLWPS